MRSKHLLCILLLVIAPGCLFAQGLTYEEQMYDFGHVGIDFKIQHTFIFVNRADVPIKIKEIYVPCDCSMVKSVDSLVQPGDTAFFYLTFDTKDFYGPVNKSFSVFTDYPKLPELEYFYVSIVGQWFSGLKPKPISLFFLPSKKKHKIQISNNSFDKITIGSVSHARDFVTTKTITEIAGKGNVVEIDVVPEESLPSGTYLTTVTVGLITDSDEETMFSIPVKIVKY